MNLPHNLFALSGLIVAVLSVLPTAVPAQGMPVNEKQVAVTIDDLPLNGPEIGLKRLREMTARLLSAIDKNKIPVVGFVNESLLYVPGETDERIAILKAWPDAGVELGNHTFSHLRFKDISLASYQEDLIRGETVTRLLLKAKGMTVRFFRHPYLQMGKTAELERAFENFIADRGYTMAPVTIDILDWMFLSAYTQARRTGDRKMVDRVSQEYLRFAAIKIESCAKASDELFARQVPQILLLHANELNADNLDGLIGIFRKQGYRFIGLEEALKDPAYRFPDNYKDTADWLSHWAFSKGRTIVSPGPPEFVQKAFESQRAARSFKD